MTLGVDVQSLHSVRHKLIAKDITLQNIKQRQTTISFVNQLDIAEGLKELIIDRGYTLDLLLTSNPGDLAETLGIDNDVAKMIIDATRRLLKSD
jgi:3-methyladenine DNA glycosylase Mpg